MIKLQKASSRCNKISRAKVSPTYIAYNARLINIPDISFSLFLFFLLLSSSQLYWPLLPRLTP